MSDLLRERASATPEATALIAPDHLDQPVSYSRLYERVQNVQDFFKETGLCPGERVGVIMENRPELLYLFFAALQGEYVPVLFHAQSTAYELSEQWSDIDGSLLVCSSQTESVARESVQHAPVLNVDEPSVAGVKPLQDADQCTARTSEGRREMQCVILFTSGSTEAPKPVCLSIENLRASALASACRLGHLPSDVWYNPLTMHHIGGLSPFVRSTLYGTAVLIESFEARKVPETFETYEVSGASMVPSMLSRILNEDLLSSPPESLRFILLGGAAAPEELVQKARDQDLPIYPSYGMTETASQVATARPGECFEDHTTVGHPLLGTEINVCDENGRPVEPGEEGIIHVDGPTVMEGYFHRPLLNERVFSSRGFRTDDHGYLDENGRLHVSTGRSNKIVTGGENVNPDEVEHILMHHERVRDAAVFGVKDAEWGEKVVAVVEVEEGETTLETDLRSELRSLLDERLAPFKHPKEITVVERVPRSAEGTLKEEEAKELMTN